MGLGTPTYGSNEWDAICTFSDGVGRRQRSQG
jgi:hypothetical protein